MPTAGDGAKQKPNIAAVMMIDTMKKRRFHEKSFTITQASLTFSVSH
jgi:hypothetical protein